LKRLFSLIICICMMLSLVPVTVQAAGKLITDVNITFPDVVVGGKPAALKDLVITNAPEVEVEQIKWEGTFDKNGCFIDQQYYTLHVLLKIKDGANAYFEPYSDDNRFAINKQDCPPMDGDDTQVYIYYFTQAKSSSYYYDAEDIYDRTTADAKDVDQHHVDFIINEEAIKASRLQDDWYAMNKIVNQSPDYDYIKRILIDYVDPSPVAFSAYDGTCNFVYFIEELKEVWLNPNVDVRKYIDLFVSHAANWEYQFHNSAGVKTREFTLVIPESAGIRCWGDLYADSIAYSGEINAGALFKIRTYSDSDVYAAFEKGIEYTNTVYCPGHKFTATLQSADRVMQYPTCSQIIKYYYSCCYCGEIEYNPNHTFSHDADQEPFDYWHSLPHGNHLYWNREINDNNYIGTNAYGEKVYLKTCYWCGINYRDQILNEYTEAEFREKYAEYVGKPGYEYLTYDWCLAEQKKQWENLYLPQALEATTREANSFAFAIYPEREVNKHTSAWAENEMNWAAQLQLIDAGLLGSDYTKSCTRLQFVSAAVKMAERMLGKEIVAAQSGTFVDTDNLYVRKAYAAGITTGTSATEFSPNATLTRQQMATFIYRALMYVRDNSEIRYTIYDSKLADYTDSVQIADWAREPMAFMNALGLIKGTSATELSPLSNCTIEQAVAVAYRSLDADEIGWYQCVTGDERNLAGVTGGTTYNNFDTIPGGGSFSLRTYSHGERLWRAMPITPANLMETEPEYDRERAMSVIDDYTGQIQWVAAEDFKAIKDLD